MLRDIYVACLAFNLPQRVLIKFAWKLNKTTDEN